MQPHLHGAAAALAASDDENRIVAGDGADDLAPARAVQRKRQGLRAAGLSQVSLRLNSIGDDACRPAYQEKLVAHFAAAKDTLCADCRTRLERNPLRILDCKNEACQRLAKTAPAMLDFLCGDCRAHFDEVKRKLSLLDIAFEVDPGIVRGLDYYTRTAFEFKGVAMGAAGTICGGGRYDYLVEEIGGPPTPGVGFGAGIERLLIALEDEGLVDAEPPAVDVFVAREPDAPRELVPPLLKELRDAGIAADATCVPIAAEDLDGIVELVERESIPLSEGLPDGTRVEIRVLLAPE